MIATSPREAKPVSILPHLICETTALPIGGKVWILTATASHSKTGGAAPPGQHAKGQRKNRPRSSRTGLLLASSFLDPLSCSLCERALPQISYPLCEASPIHFRREMAPAQADRLVRCRDRGYYFNCALTGYRLDTETISIVQAAHIHQHAISGNDDSRNGLALTPDVHWMFDAGLWTVIPRGDDLLIHVAIGRFTESSPHGRLLAAFNGRLLNFHIHARLRPDHEHFAWHCKMTFLKRP